MSHGPIEKNLNSTISIFIILQIEKTMFGVGVRA